MSAVYFYPLLLSDISCLQYTPALKDTYQLSINEAQIMFSMPLLSQSHWFSGNKLNNLRSSWETFHEEWNYGNVKMVKLWVHFKYFAFLVLIQLCYWLPEMLWIHYYTGARNTLVFRDNTFAMNNYYTLVVWTHYNRGTAPTLVAGGVPNGSLSHGKVGHGSVLHQDDVLVLCIHVLQCLHNNLSCRGCLVGGVLRLVYLHLSHFGQQDEAVCSLLAELRRGE